MLWEYLPFDRRNPIEIVRIRNVTKRQNEAVVLSPEQFRDVIRRLPAHVNMISITMACLGLRVSEALGLQWQDSAYRGSIDETKTSSSKAKLPLAPLLADLLLA
jgi:integrase